MEYANEFYFFNSNNGWFDGGLPRYCYRTMGKAYYRKEHRLKIMERLAALASIFIYVNEDNEIVILNEEDPNETLAYKKQRIRRLFVMDEIIIAKDIDSDKTLGIESMNVTSGIFLSKYLYGSEKLTGLLTKKALEYNSKQP